MQESSPESIEYSLLERLEELESLLEELEEAGISDISSSNAAMPEALREGLDAAGIRDLQDLRGQILALHSQIDYRDEAAEISES